MILEKYVKKREGRVPTRPHRSRRHACTISKNVDDFLEVERRGNKVAGSLFYFIDLRSEFPMLKYGLPTNHFETVQLGVVDPPLEGLP